MQAIQTQKLLCYHHVCRLEHFILEHFSSQDCTYDDSLIRKKGTRELIDADNRGLLRKTRLAIEGVTQHLLNLDTVHSVQTRLKLEDKFLLL